MGTILRHISPISHPDLLTPPLRLLYPSTHAVSRVHLLCLTHATVCAFGVASNGADTVGE